MDRAQGTDLSEACLWEQHRDDVLRSSVLPEGMQRSNTVEHDVLAILGQFLCVMNELKKRGLVHCDLKEANVMYDYINRELRLVDCESIGRLGSKGGVYTPQYIPPEHLRAKVEGREFLRTESEAWYAIGIMLYGMMTGCLDPHLTDQDKELELTESEACELFLERRQAPIPRYDSWLPAACLPSRVGCRNEGSIAEPLFVACTEAEKEASVKAWHVLLNRLVSPDPSDRWGFEQVLTCDVLVKVHPETLAKLADHVPDAADKFRELQAEQARLVAKGAKPAHFTAATTSFSTSTASTPISPPPPSYDLALDMPTHQGTCNVAADITAADVTAVAAQQAALAPPPAYYLAVDMPTSNGSAMSIATATSDAYPILPPPSPYEMAVLMPSYGSSSCATAASEASPSLPPPAKCELTILMPTYRGSATTISTATTVTASAQAPDLPPPPPYELAIRMPTHQGANSRSAKAAASNSSITKSTFSAASWASTLTPPGSVDGAFCYGDDGGNGDLSTPFYFAAYMPRYAGSSSTSSTRSACTGSPFASPASSCALSLGADIFFSPPPFHMNAGTSSYRSYGTNASSVSSFTTATITTAAGASAPSLPPYEVAIQVPELIREASIDSITLALPPLPAPRSTSTSTFAPPSPTPSVCAAAHPTDLPPPPTYEEALLMETYSPRSPSHHAEGRCTLVGSSCNSTSSLSSTSTCSGGMELHGTTVTSSPVSSPCRLSLCSTPLPFTPSIATSAAAADSELPLQLLSAARLPTQAAFEAAYCRLHRNLPTAPSATVSPAWGSSAASLATAASGSPQQLLLPGGDDALEGGSLPASSIPSCCGSVSTAASSRAGSFFKAPAAARVPFDASWYLTIAGLGTPAAGAYAGLYGAAGMDSDELLAQVCRMTPSTARLREAFGLAA